MAPSVYAASKYSFENSKDTFLTLTVRWKIKSKLVYYLVRFIGGRVCSRVNYVRSRNKFC